MKIRTTITMTVLVSLLVIIALIWNENLFATDPVTEDTPKIALLEASIKNLAAENEALAKENRQLENDLKRINGFREELSEDIRWYIKLSESPLTTKEAKEVVGHLTDDIIKAIKGFDPKLLARYIHPTKGVGFSASAMISRSDPVFTQKQVSDFVSEPQVYIWGIYSGSGDKMILSPKAYFTEVLYNRKFEESPVRFNEVYDDFRGNHYLVYPNSVVVEYFYEGTKEGGFVDTAVLRIVFQQHDEQNWYVVGIIYNDRG